MKKIIFRTIELIKIGKYRWIPSSLAFYFLISFIPLLFSIVIVLIRYVTNEEEIVRSIIKVEELQPYISKFIEYIRDDFSDISVVALILLLLYSTFLSSNGIKGVIYAVNSFFGFEKISYLKTSILSYLVALIILVSILVMVLFISIVPSIVELLNINVTFTRSYIYIPVIVYIIMHLIYAIVSDFRLKASQIYKGALFTTIVISFLLVLSSYLFYQTRVSIIYGSLAIIVLVSHFTLYISYAIYIGIAINVASYQMEQESIDSDTV